MQRTLLIVAGVIVVAGLGVLAYFVFFNKPSVNVSTSTTVGSTLPDAGNATSSIQVVPNTVSETSSSTSSTGRLVEISKDPVALGEVAFVATSTASSTEIAVNYIARQSGNVFTYNAQTGSVTRISNKTIPGIEEARWLPDGSFAFVRYLSGADLNTVNTYALPSNGGGGYFLAQGISGLSVTAGQLLSLVSSGNGSTLTTMKPDGSGTHQVFATPLSQVRADFLGKNYLVFTKPSLTLSGYAFLVSASGISERIAGPLTGLVGLASPKGNWVLFSYTSGGTLKMALLNIQTRQVIALPLGTIADKCVWTLDETSLYCAVPVDPPTTFAYPDDWYQGAVSFNDDLWRIDVAGHYASHLVTLSKDANETVDATGLTVDPTNHLLVFRNRIDGTLWAYSL